MIAGSKCLVGFACLAMLASCDEAAESSDEVAVETNATPVSCAIKASACTQFVEGLSSFGASLNKPVSQRNAIDVATVTLLASTLRDLQNDADDSCTPIVGDLREIARLDTGDGSPTALLGSGAGVCTLVNIR